MLVAALLVQAVAGPPPPAPSRPRAAAPCPVGDTADVVVCARADDAYRLKRLPPRADARALPKAAIRIGNAQVAAEAEQATLFEGMQSRRLMVRLKVPLGRGKRAR